MSSIYISEPPTKGKVLLVTTLGEFDIELWSKEAPLACRNFVQLCMESYYTGSIFHRVVRNFCAQAGDPTGTGEGGESIHGQPFKDEFHQRLNFSRRGLVAMANGGKNDNGSQFFFTLDRADELKNKHTIFGKVTGQTLYNLPKFNDLETDKEDRPVDPPKILRAEILSNPFDDIVPRDTRTKFAKSEKEKPQSQSQATKNFNLLSFGEEAEEEDEEMETASKDIRIKSSHDVLRSDPNLSSEPVMSDQTIAAPEGEQDDRNEGDLPLEQGKERSTKRNASSRDDDSKEPPAMSRLDEIRREAKRLKKELKKGKQQKEEEVQRRKEEEDGDVLKEYKAERSKYLTRGQMTKMGASRGEDKTQDLFATFKKKLSKAHKQDVSEDVEERSSEDSTSWLGHRLSFADAEEGPKVVKDASVKTSDTYDLYDPRNSLTKRRREKKK